jgi:hypothetical protein
VVGALVLLRTLTLQLVTLRLELQTQAAVVVVVLMAGLVVARVQVAGLVL